jgi:hypothetical protein
MAGNFSFGYINSKIGNSLVIVSVRIIDIVRPVDKSIILLEHSAGFFVHLI